MSLTQAPANSVASVRAAGAAGLQTVEVDACLTRDMHVVSVHPTVFREQISPTRAYVEELELAEIRDLDAGRWFSPAHAGARVPLLREVVQAAAGAGLRRIIVDLKPGSDLLPGAVRHPNSSLGTQLARQACAAVRPYLGQIELVLWCKDDAVVEEVAACLPPPGRLGYVVANETLDFRLRGLAGGLRLPASVASVHWQMGADRTLVRRLQHHGKLVVGWTANTEAMTAGLVSGGVDVILTNHPFQATVWAAAARRRLCGPPPPP